MRGYPRPGDWATVFADGARSRGILWGDPPEFLLLQKSLSVIESMRLSPAVVRSLLGATVPLATPALRMDGNIHNPTMLLVNQ